MGVPSHAEVLKWMEDNGKGYKLTARHFGISVSRVRRMKARGAAVPTPDQTVDWAALPADAYWAHIVNTGIRMAGETKGIAAKDHLRTSMDARKMLDACRPAPVETLAPDEVYAQLECDMLQWDDTFFVLALRIYGERHGGRLLLVTDTHRAELVDGAWVTAGR